MGRFETINTEGLKIYTLFSKRSINKVLDAIVSMGYACDEQDRARSNSIYVDSQNNLLSSAGILLSKVVEEGKAYFKVEKEEYFTDKKSIIPKQKKVFIHPIGVKDIASDHSLFLVDGISSMFSTKFHIDLENVLKTVVPRLEIESRKNIFRILSGKGFKAEMVYERVFIRNYFTKRRAEVMMLEIKHTSSIGGEEFKKFSNNLEKRCKEIMPTNETKYEIAKKMTTVINKK